MKRQNRANAANEVIPLAWNDSEDGTVCIDDMEERSAAKAELRRLLSKLTPEERKMLVLWFGSIEAEAQDDGGGCGGVEGDKNE